MIIYLVMKDIDDGYSEQPVIAYTKENSARAFIEKEEARFRKNRKRPPDYVILPIELEDKAP